MIAASGPRGDVRRVVREIALLAPRTAVLLGRLVADPRVPVTRKVVAGLGLLYAVSPLDLVPDFVPGLGRLDDVLIAGAALATMVDAVPREVLVEHWGGDEESLEVLLGLVAFIRELAPVPPWR